MTTVIQKNGVRKGGDHSDSAPFLLVPATTCSVATR